MRSYLILVELILCFEKIRTVLESLNLIYTLNLDISSMGNPIVKQKYVKWFEGIIDPDVPEELIPASYLENFVTPFLEFRQQEIRERAKGWPAFYSKLPKATWNKSMIVNSKVAFLASYENEANPIKGSLKAALLKNSQRNFLEDLILARIELNDCTNLEKLIKRAQSKYNLDDEEDAIKQKQFEEMFELPSEAVDSLCTSYREKVEYSTEEEEEESSLKEDLRFLRTTPGMTLFCYILNPSVRRQVILTNCAPRDITALRNMSDEVAWEYCDKKFIIPFIDKKRSNYQSGKEGVPSFVDDIVKGVVGGLEKSKATDSTILSALKELTTVVNRTYNQLVSSGERAPITEVERPVYTPPEPVVPSSSGVVTFRFG